MELQAIGSGRNAFEGLGKGLMGEFGSGIDHLDIWTVGERRGTVAEEVLA